eukprot:TRINITY_DN24424_c0_g1_i1.p1 TRINITY_DN24424_c0_g1~~TRINITY_DN24424_c0_g1_i1.p1  ORF type:complete len:500 (-),score=42.91 TRINITY_DN24424_c0_g1_i1:101-1600(-)
MRLLSWMQTWRSRSWRVLDMADDPNDGAGSSRMRPYFDGFVFLGVGMANVWTVVIYALVLAPTSPVFDRSDVAMALSPIADPTIITPFIWSFFALCLAVTPCALLTWRRKRHEVLTRAATVGPCCARVSRCVVYLALMMPLLTFIAFIMLPTGMCTKGAFFFAKGGYCVCDKRPLLEANGVPKYVKTPENLTFAFVGDTDLDNVEHVYNLIRGEHVDGVLLNGDMDYWGTASDWDRLYQKYLAGVPFYVTVGNHETWTWRDYQDLTAKRWSEAGVNECRGSIGVRNICTHKGIGLLLSGAGSGCGGSHPTHTPFFADTLKEFADNDVIWRICAFHKPEESMTLGATTARVGYDKYELCRQHGSIVITSHSHLYGRTHELSMIGSQTRRVSRKVFPGSGPDSSLIVGNGTTFAVITGLGGGTLESGDQALLQDAVWAATWDNSKYLAPGQEVHLDPADNIDFGAFFCTFHVNGDPRLARCYFKDIQGRVVDDFYVRRAAE